VEPAVILLDRRWALAIFDFVDRMINARIDDAFLASAGFFHVGTKCPTDTAAGASVDEAVLRSRIERVFALHEFGMEDDVALLRGGCLDVRQALPFFQVLCADKPALGNRARLVGWLGFRIATLSAKEAINPAVLVLDDAHIINVRIWLGSLGNYAWFVPETEVIEAVLGFGDSEKAFSIPALDAHADDDLPVLLNRAGIKCGIDAEALQEVGIGFRIQIKAPFQRNVICRNDWVRVALVNAIRPCGINSVFAFNERFMSAS